MNLANAIFVTGPTGVGKSEVALRLAKNLRGELISVDSMQVYRGLDIGTAKPTQEERAEVPHHLIDITELSQQFDVAEWVRRAGKSAEEIQAPGKLAIFCGGTGFYLKALFEGLGESPGAETAIRRELEQTPIAELLGELQQKDPEMFARIDQQNLRRVVRALEVIRITGRSFSEQRAPWQERRSEQPSNEPERRRVFCLERDREDLRNRIEERVERMFRAGLIDETERLLTRGLRENRTAMQSIGYRQVVEYLEGKRSLEETIGLVKTRTCQLAKRQMTWFRHQLDVKWVKINADETSGQVAQRLAGEFRLRS